MPRYSSFWCNYLETNTLNPLFHEKDENDVYYPEHIYNGKSRPTMRSAVASDHVYTDIDGRMLGITKHYINFLRLRAEE